MPPFPANGPKPSCAPKEMMMPISKFASAAPEVP